MRVPLTVQGETLGLLCLMGVTVKKGEHQGLRYALIHLKALLRCRGHDPGGVGQDWVPIPALLAC